MIRFKFNKLIKRPGKLISDRRSKNLDEKSISELVSNADFRESPTSNKYSAPTKRTGNYGDWHALKKAYDEKLRVKKETRDQLLAYKPDLDDPYIIK